jgi:hypothetical protein
MRAIVGREPQKRMGNVGDLLLLGLYHSYGPESRLSESAGYTHSETPSRQGGAPSHPVGAPSHPAGGG